MIFRKHPKKRAHDADARFRCHSLVRINIGQQFIAQAQGADRGQWKIAGETVWHDSDATVEDLPAGPYDILFKPVAGRQTPPPQTVDVAGDILYSVTGTYLIASVATGAEPQPVDFATLQTEPYGFVGQVRSSVGLNSSNPSNPS